MFPLPSQAPEGKALRGQSGKIAYALPPSETSRVSFYTSLTAKTRLVGVAAVRVARVCDRVIHSRNRNLRPVLFFHGASIQVSFYGPITAANSTISHSLQKLIAATTSVCVSSCKP
jgi:hypothetical protein